jgi:heat shock protein HslJ
MPRSLPVANARSSRSLHRVGAVVLSALGLSSCAAGVTDPSDVTGQRWRLVTLQLAGSPAVQVTQPDRYTLELEPDGDITVTADCNGCGGRYTMDGTALDVPALACTLALCGAPSLGGEYVVILEGASSFRLDDDRLELSSARGRLAFTR